MAELEAWKLDHLQNVGHCLTETAARFPDQTAVAAPTSKRGTLSYQRITFGQLEVRSNRIANLLIAQGVVPGTKLALMVPPGIEFVAHVFALFKAGAEIVLIDPGMGRKNMIRCLEAVSPDGFVGIRLAQVARWVFRKKFPKAKLNFVTDARWWFGCISTQKTDHADSFEPLNIKREDPAAIIFTTGSTGPPKGVLYRHRIFIQQAQQIRDYFDIRPGTVDVSGFPLFALFNTAMGTTTVFPRMDATRPADVHPPDIIHAVNEFQADQSFGSPALWNTVTTYCEARKIQLPTIRRVLSAGAPVPPATLRRIKDTIHPEGDAFTPYGATEALPVACQSATNVLNETAAATHRGAGTCVGKRFSGIQWKVIQISDEPLSEMAQVVEMPMGEIGELMVQGDVVTDQYVTRQEANADHKVQDGDSFWHRMGDVGYLDDQDRFWMCGRKSHRVRTTHGDMFTVPCEAIANTHQDIYRSALVGVGDEGRQIPVMIVEPLPGRHPQNQMETGELIAGLAELLSEFDVTRRINPEHILVHEKLPTDIRHNSKIFREQLRPWAAEKLNESH